MAYASGLKVFWQPGATNEVEMYYRGRHFFIPRHGFSLTKRVGRPLAPCGAQITVSFIQILFYHPYQVLIDVLAPKNRYQSEVLN